MAHPAAAVPDATVSDPGAALMFFPEANVLMKGDRDPRCGTPAFKRVPVLVRPQPPR
jgi:formylmethanofuran dehydrogenase subunit D